MTAPTQPNQIERKVTVSSVATYLGLVALLAVLNGVADTNLISSLPDVVEVFVMPLLPTAITFVSGYMAKHTPRPGDGTLVNTNTGTVFTQ